MTTTSSSRTSLFVLCIGWWTLLLACSSSSVLTNAFVVFPVVVAPQAFRVTATKPLATAAQDASATNNRATSSDAADQHDDNELVARRIVLTGDVQGGYYRSCVLNEVGATNLSDLML